MKREDFPPDYTPLSLSGSAMKDGDREIENTLSAPTGFVTFFFVVVIII